MTIDLAALDIRHYFVGGVYAKETLIEPGIALAQHKHTHDHMAILAAGSVVLEVEGEACELHAPAIVKIDAHKHHTVHAITSAVWYCIWPDDADDDERIEGSSADLQAMAEAAL